MWLKIVIVLIIVVLAVAMLSFNVIFKKDGKFPNTHISGSKAMKERGIDCNVSQDREAQKSTKKYK